VSVVFWIVYSVLWVFMLIMWVRLIFDLIMNFNRGWRPTGVAVLIAEVAFTVTDPPIKAVRRVVPPLRLGDLTLDFAWTIVLLAAIILSSVAFRFL